MRCRGRDGSTALPAVRGCALRLRLLTLVFLCGATAWISAGSAEGGKPLSVALCYYPYGSGLVRSLATPVPDYEGWTDERMQRDIGRMVSAGVDVVLLQLDLSGGGEEFRLERYRRFLEVVDQEAGDAKLTAVFWLNSVSTSALTEFVRWHVRRGVGALGSHYRVKGQPVVMLGHGVAASPVRHPALGLRKADVPDADWSLGPDRGERVWVRADGRVAVLRPGLAPADGSRTKDKRWPLPRRNGRPLWEALTSLASLEGELPARIVVRSWNDFSSGDFVEPNSLDGKRMLRSLTEGIERLRAQASSR